MRVASSDRLTAHTLSAFPVLERALPRRRKRSHAPEWAAAGAIAGLGAGVLATGIIGALGSLFARAVVTPSRVLMQNVHIVSVDIEDGAYVVELQSRDPEVRAPGVYSLWFDQDRGHAKLGEVLSAPNVRTVRRRVLSVDRGDLLHATRGRMAGNVFIDPQDAGVEAENVQVPLTAGPAPAWKIPGTYRKDTWAIMIHGRGATRLETLRGMSTLQRLGVTVLSMSYRNDGEGPDVNNGRYGLGATEWHDVEAAIADAVSQGAQEIVLVGWSMGGGIALRTAELSRFRTRIRAIALTGPATDWFQILRFQAKINRLPYLSGRLGEWLLTRRIGKRLTGLTAPIDLNALDWVEHAEQIRVPVLIQHSEDDDFVPFVSSVQVAERNPKMVTLKRFTGAGHVREWNVDAKAWEENLFAWLDRQLGSV